MISHFIQKKKKSCTHTCTHRHTLNGHLNVISKTINPLEENVKENLHDLDQRFLRYNAKSIIH